MSFDQVIEIKSWNMALRPSGYRLTWRKLKKGTIIQFGEIRSGLVWFGLIELPYIPAKEQVARWPED